MVAPAQGFQATAFAGGGATGAVDLDSAETAGTLPIAKGGTAATTAATARTNIDVDVAGTAATGDTAHLAAFAHANIPSALPVAVAQGGTGATTAAAARTNLAAAAELIAVNAQTGTQYEIVLADGAPLTLITLSNAAAILLKVPANASTAFPIGTQIMFAQLGAGQVSVDPAGGVTISSAGNELKLAAQYSQAVLTKIGTNTWLLSGDTAV